MKTIATVLLLAMLSGCMAWNAAKLPETPTAPPPPRAAAPVTVDQVNSGNAHQMAAALDQELDRERQ